MTEEWTSKVLITTIGQCGLMIAFLVIKSGQLVNPIIVIDHHVLRYSGEFSRGPIFHGFRG